ncbi:MAG TPA: hypothetical protein VGF45_18655 [Polyangia bacterium]
MAATTIVAAQEALPVRLSLPAAGLPFPPAELEAAVETRVGLARGPGPAADVAVTPTPTAGTVMVMSRHRLEEVSVAGKAPAEAARLVALAVVAVTRPVSAIATAAAPAERSSGGDGTAGIVAGATGAVSTGARPWTLGLSTGLAHGLPSGEVVSESSLDGTFGLGTQGQWEVAASLGFARVNAAATFSGALALNTLPVRVSLRRRWGWLGLGAGPVVRWYDVAGPSVDGVAVPGASGHVSAELPVAGGLRLRATLSCDAYLDELVFRSNGREVMRTARVVPWLGVGLFWGRS